MTASFLSAEAEARIAIKSRLSNRKLSAIFIASCLIYTVINVHIWSRLSLRSGDFVPDSYPQLEHSEDYFESVVTEQASRTAESIENENDYEDWRSEKAVFEKMLARARSSRTFCDDLDPSPDAPKVQMKTDIPLLKEFGIIDAINSWNSEAEKVLNRETCRLPPSTLCDATGWTVIMLSHENGNNLRIRGIASLASRSETKEIIFVYNSPRDTLTDENILRWDADKDHPLRIFYALEHGLSNNLFNRYHPSLKPKMETLLFFDDDGPFFVESPIEAGFELFKRNSGVQVGCMPRKIQFKNPDGRMQKAMNQEMKFVVKQAEKGWQAVSPYDKETTSQTLKNLNSNPKDSEKHRHPSFISSCRASGDTFSYRYHEFTPFLAHMTLPSGSFLHRNFLCFLWHPVFEEVREYVLKHPTHPDDATVSAIITQLTGKVIRTYSKRARPRDIGMKVEPWEAKRQLPQNYVNSKHVPSVLKTAVKKYAAMKLPNGIITYGANQWEKGRRLMQAFMAESLSRRRLLWNEDEWPHLRTEAINSLVGFFGSINPGSVGYCLGTSHYLGNYKCDHEMMVWDKVPWIWEGGLGNDQCYKDGK